jgi:autotransporter-associated beta strand protein
MACVVSIPTGHLRGPRLVALVVALALAAPRTGSAVTYYWAGASGVSMGTAANWSTSPSTVTGGVVPSATDDTIFNINANNASSLNVSLGAANRTAVSQTFLSTGSTVFIRSNSGTSSSTSNLTIGAGGITLNAGAGAVTYGTTDQRPLVRMAAAFPITNNSSSTVTFNESFEPASAVATPIALTLQGSGTGAIVFANAVNNNSTTGTLSVVVNTAAAATTLFDNANTFSGGTTLAQGILGVGSATALGTGTLTINGGALAAKTSARTLANPVVVGGSFVLGGIGGGFTPAALTLAGGVDLGGASRTITLKNSATITGNVTSGGISLTGSFGGSSRVLTLSGTNTYAAGTVVSSGTLRAGSAAAFGSGTVTVSGGAVDLNARTDVANAFTMNGGLLDNGTINSSQLGGGSGTVNAVVTGSAAFSKNASGILTLSNVNSYAGQTLVTSGTLLVTGTLTQSQATVSATATLGGTGSVAGGLTLQPGGFVQPGLVGSDVGTLATGPLTLAGTYVATITGTATSLLDRLVVTGNADFTGGTILPVLNGYTPLQNDRFQVLTWTGARTGMPTFDFSQASLSSGLSWDTSSFGTDGTLIVVPEPDAIALSAAAMVIAVLIRRRLGP